MEDVSLPSFRHPPVVETVLGVQFEPLPAFVNAHLGAFWKFLGPGWPVVKDAPALPQEFERFGDDRAWRPVGSINVRVTDKPQSRIQIVSDRKDRMVQLQNGKLFYNWVGGDADNYPRYEAIRPGLNATLERLRAFVASEGLGELRLNQWEATYVNHIPKGTVWNTPEDWGRVLNWRRLFGEPTPGVQLENIGGGWHYVIDPKRGRLHADVHHGYAGDPSGPEVLVLTLTARGPLRESDDAFSVDAGLRLGHTVIVKSFAGLTSDEAQRFWERVE